LSGFFVCFGYQYFSRIMTHFCGQFMSPVTAASHMIAPQKTKIWT